MNTKRFHSAKPIIITMGDPSGIGPELIDAMGEKYADEKIVIIGDKRALRSDARLIKEPEEALSGLNIISDPAPLLPQKGKMQSENADAVIRWIEKAVKYTQNQRTAALLTAPINKAMLKNFGFEFPGHTEFLAKLDQKKSVVMLLTSPSLSVVPATIHIALKDVPQHFTKEKLREVIEITHSALFKQEGKKPHLAIIGLNPHAGENGHIGSEEIDFIQPLIEEMRVEGFWLSGPWPADTAFHEKARAQYDIAICAYHDQALIPIKTLAFDEGVNVTLGLSFLRASPDHGTAYDIAGRNLANPSSFFAAYEYLKARI